MGRWRQRWWLLMTVWGVCVAYSVAFIALFFLFERCAL